MQEQTIFTEALEKEDPAERAAFLEGACAGDERLRQRVERLLGRHDHAGSFLEQPVLSGDATTDHQPPISEQPGTVISPYKLLQQIGEGGMGVVFMAEQTHPVQRTVALKIIKPGMDTRQVIARFEAERQALAMMDHPNIAKVLDAGTTDTDRPYFVMELVKGVPITKYCDEKQLSLSERLELFMPVCQAVQHAHQKGIIHRDIKPTNVLVAEYDNRAVPKVIDFGVAKATAQKLTERTMFTEFGQVVGTVEYMSPEQAKLNQLDIDTRSDIYSLGVLLYELLTGSTPFEQKRLREAAFDEVLRIIREEEPTKPSTRLSTSDTLPSIAANRHAEPARLSKEVRGELDWIVMKCLEKDRNRRYETANGLANDLQRYLVDEPVQACPPSAIYRLRKFARRYRAALATTGILAATLIIGALVSTAQAIRATRAEGLAEQRLHAETQAKKEAQAVTDFLVAAFESPDPARDGRTVTVVEVLDRAEQRLDDDLPDQPLTRAALLEAIGVSRRGLGLPREAISPLVKAHALRNEILGADDLVTLRTMTRLGSAYDSAGRKNESWAILEQSLGTLRKKFGSDHRDTLLATRLLASAYFHFGRDDEAMVLQEQTLKAYRATLGPSHTETLATMASLASIYHSLGRLDEAINLQEKVVAERRNTLGTNHPDTVSAGASLARSYAAAGRWDEATKLYEESLVKLRDKLGADHPNTLFTKLFLAHAYSRAGRRSEGISLYEQALVGYRKTLGSAHPTTLMTMNTLGLAYWVTGQNDKAIKLLEEAVAGWREARGLSEADTLIAMSNLASAYVDAGRVDEAIHLHEQTLAGKRKTYGAENFRTANSMHGLAYAYHLAGRLEDAIALNEQTVAMRAKLLGADDRDTLYSLHNLLTEYNAAGRLDNANGIAYLEYGLYIKAHELIGKPLLDFDSAIPSENFRGKELVPVGISETVLQDLGLTTTAPDVAQAFIDSVNARGKLADFMYKTLGLCLLAQSKVKEANDAFRTVLADHLKQDGTYDLVNADANEMAAAYFLGLLTEKDYTAYHRDRDDFPCFAWFSVGQRKDLQGDAGGAAAAYRRCLESDEKGGSRAIVSLVRWRLKKLEAGAPDRTEKDK